MKRILIALDGSPRADGVLAAGIDLARASSAKLVLFRAISILPEIPKEWSMAEGTLTEFLQKKAIEYLDGCAARVPADLFASHRTFVRIASPWQGVCEAAREEGADVVVIGSHGYSGIDHVLGTTAAKVVNHAPCSVFVVRTT